MTVTQIRFEDLTHMTTTNRCALPIQLETLVKLSMQAPGIDGDRKNLPNEVNKWLYAAAVTETVKATGDGMRVYSALSSLSSMDGLRTKVLYSEQSNFDTMRGSYYVVVRYQTVQQSTTGRNRKTTFQSNLFFHVTAGGLITQCGKNGINDDITINSDLDWLVAKSKGSNDLTIVTGDASCYPPVAKSLANLISRTALDINVRIHVNARTYPGSDPDRIYPDDYRFRKLLGRHDVIGDDRGLTVLRSDIIVAKEFEILEADFGYCMYPMSEAQADALLHPGDKGYDKETLVLL